MTKPTLLDRVRAAQLRGNTPPAEMRLLEEVEAELMKLRAMRKIKYKTHPSWNCSEEFNAGWKACRELMGELLE